MFTRICRRASCLARNARSSVLARFLRETCLCHKVRLYHPMGWLRVDSPRQLGVSGVGDLRSPGDFPQLEMPDHRRKVRARTAKLPTRFLEKQVGIMFKNSCDEEKLCQVLKAYVEEWGPENVIVSVPRHWSEYSTSSLGRVRLEFATRDTVSIRVEYDFVRLNYDVQLQAA